MAETLKINCVGMKCPRPIIEIAKAYRRLPKGSTLEIEADDLAFESDVKAWVESSNTTLERLVKENDKIFAIIKL